VTLCALSVFAVSGICGKTPARAAVLDGLAAVGPGSASNAPTNYPGLMQTYRGLNFGGAGIPYAFGKVGADSLSILTPGNQVDQAVAQILAGNITLVTISDGENDYIDVADEIASGALSGAALASFQQTVNNNIINAVDRLRSAGAALVMGGYSNITYSPAAASIAADPVAKARLENALSGGNDLAVDFVNSQGIPFIDFFALQTEVYEAGSAQIGGVNLILNGYNSDPHYFFEDPFHAGILVRGAIANLFIQAINEGYGTSIPLLSDLEILALGGLEDEYVEETFAEAYAYPSYVSVPEPSALALAGACLALGAVIAATRRRRA
jgi:hypothetical protein